MSKFAVVMVTSQYEWKGPPPKTNKNNVIHFFPMGIDVCRDTDQTLSGRWQDK